MTERPATPAERADRLAALQGRGTAGRTHPQPPAQLSKIITTGLAASLTLGLVTAMGWSSADANSEPTPTPTPMPAAPVGPAAPPAAGPATVPSTAMPFTTLVEVTTTAAGRPADVATAPVVVAQATVPPAVTPAPAAAPAPAATAAPVLTAAPAPAPAPVVIDVAVPTPQPAPAAPVSGGSSNGSTQQSK